MPNIDAKLLSEFEGDLRGTAGFKKHIGHQIYKFNQEGKVVMRLGEAGVSGDDQQHFNGPTGVVVCSMFTSRHIRHNIGAIRVWHGDVSMQAVIDALTADSRSPAVATEAS